MTEPQVHNLPLALSQTLATLATFGAEFDHGEITEMADGSGRYAILAEGHDGNAESDLTYYLRTQVCPDGEILATEELPDQGRS